MNLEPLWRRCCELRSEGGVVLMSSKNAALAVGIGLAALMSVCVLGLLALGALLVLWAGRSTPGFSPFGLAPTPAATQSAAEIADQMAQIESQVMALRGLSATGPVEWQLMTAVELREYNIESFAEDYSRDEAWNDTLTLAAFGLLDSSFPLYDFYLDLYSEDILGFYDPDVGKLFIITERGRLGAVERVTFAHEFQHALQDQNYGLEALGLSREGWRQDSERAAGVQALIEGEATLLEQQWQAKHFTKADWADYEANAYADPDSAYFRAPAYLQKDFYFPYDWGYQFVKRLYDRGGWPAVDAAYRRPPVSTEMILHPEKYDADEVPQLVASLVLTDTLGAGWQQTGTGVMGEWYTVLVLEQHIGEAEAAQAAAGWGGDSYTVSYHAATGGTVAAWHIVWDTNADAEEFVDAFKEYGDARFGGEAAVGSGSLCWMAACLYFSPRATLWIMAPDPAAVERLRQTIDF